MEIAPAVQRARDSGTAVRREGLWLDERSEISIEVIPLERSGAEPGFLILFDEGSGGSEVALGSALCQFATDRDDEQ